MAITRVSRVQGGSTAGASSVASPAQSHAAGNLLVALVDSNHTGAGVTSVSDTAGNTWHHAGSNVNDGSNDIDIYYAYNITGHASNVVTANFSGSPVYRAIVVLEFSGSFGTSDPYVGGSQAGTTGSGTAISSGTITTGSGDNVIVAWFLAVSDTIADTSPAYNTTNFAISGDAVKYFADGYHLVTASEAAVASCASSAWIASAAAFHEASVASPPITYDEWIERPAAQRIVLADIQAGYQLRGWTADGGGAYYVAYDLQSHPAAVRADRGLYRGLDAVWENGTPLTLRASIASVQANSGSYFYDSGTGRIYIRTSGAVNPDTVASILAVFHVCVSTEPKNFTSGVDRPYDAQIDPSRLPSLLTEQGDPVLGVSVFPSGDLALVNSDGFWDTLAYRSYSGTSGWIFENMTVTFRLGGETMAFNDYPVIATMQIARPPAASPDTCVFQLRSLSNATATAFPQHTFDQHDATSAITQNLVGVYLPMLFGYGFDMPLVLRIAGGGSFGFDNRYWSVDPMAFTAAGWLVVTAVYARPASGGVRQTVASTDWNGVDPFNGTIDIDETNWPHADWTFSCDAYTANSSTGVPLFATFGALAKQILTLCGVPTASIDTAAFTQADVDAPQRLGLYIAGGGDVSVFESGQELINRLEKSVGGSVHPSAAYPYTARVWNPSFDLANTTILDETEFLGSAVEVDDSVSEQIVSSVTVRYAQNVVGESWQTASASSTEAAATLGSSGLAVDTCLVDPPDAVARAQQLMVTSSLPTLKLRALAGPRLMTATPWQKFRLVLRRGPSASAGSFDQILEVIRLNKQLADVTVDVTFGNQRGLGESARAIAPDGTPDWNSATADQKRQYLFVCDDTTQRADNSDASSFRAGVVV